MERKEEMEHNRQPEEVKLKTAIHQDPELTSSHGHTRIYSHTLNNFLRKKVQKLAEQLLHMWEMRKRPH